jgi:hypothetical protein
MHGSKKACSTTATTILLQHTHNNCSLYWLLLLDPTVMQYLRSRSVCEVKVMRTRTRNSDYAAQTTCERQKETMRSLPWVTLCFKLRVMDIRGTKHESWAGFILNHRLSFQVLRGGVGGFCIFVQISLTIPEDVPSNCTQTSTFGPIDLSNQFLSI